MSATPMAVIAGDAEQSGVGSHQNCDLVLRTAMNRDPYCSPATQIQFAPVNIQILI